MMKLQYVRTDKNGTKYFYDWTCPRCGGAGQSDKWLYTGRICYGCGGTGKRAKPLTVKEYTPDYKAKLDARRAAKEAKREAEAKKYAEEHADEIEAKRLAIIEQRYAEHGCGKDGIGYVLTGNTYPVKEQIKKNGGKWDYGVWICPVDIKGDGIKSKMINLSGHVGGGSEYWLDGFCFRDEIY